MKQTTIRYRRCWSRRALLVMLLALSAFVFAACAPIPTGTPTPSAQGPSPSAAQPVLGAATPLAATQPAALVAPTPAAATGSPADTASAAKTAAPSDALPLRGVTIGIDPGHQGRGNPEKEPQAPGSSIMKAKVTSGATGSFSKVQEHTVNLAVGLALKQKLEEAGARVVMTRRSADVDISNAQRAQLFNEQAVDLGIRLHCNAADSESAQGALMLLPQQNPYQSLCERAGSSILQAYVAATGFPSEGIRRLGDQTGFNWCARPIVNLEMGYLTNRSEDLKLSDPAFQQTMAEGIYRGVLNYFAKAGSRLEG